MPITAADFISNQFKKAGVEPSAEMKEVLGNPELTKINLDDKQVKDMNEKLMTLDVAKQSPVLKAHFRQESLAPIDTEIHEKYLTEYGIADDVDLSNAIKNEKNTYEKIQLLVKAVKNLHEKKATAQVGDKKHLTDKIDELNNSILTLKEQFKNEKSNILKDSANKELNWNIRGKFSGYNYSDQYDKADAMELAMINLTRQLQADNAKVILAPDGQLKLVQAIDESLDFTRENQKVSFDDYAAKLVTDKKLIKTNEPTKITTANPQSQPALNPNNQYQPLPKALNEAQQSLRDIGIMNENGTLKV
jgi:hypothetical protein